MQIVRAFALAMLVAVVLPCRVNGQEYSVEERIARFKLLTKCTPIRLLVEDLPEDAREISLTRQRIQNMAESRLRAARMYDEEVHPHLYINVNVVGRAWSVILELNKVLDDQVSGHQSFASTWDSGSTGTHGGDAGYIMQSVSEHLDRFILEYLRVNEEYCDA